MSVEVERPQEVPAAVRILLRYLPVGRHDLLMAQAGIQDSVCDCRLDVAEQQLRFRRLPITPGASDFLVERLRSEEHTSELQSLMRISYAVFCLKKKNNYNMNYNNKDRTYK